MTHTTYRTYRITAVTNLIKRWWAEFSDELTLESFEQLFIKWEIDCVLKGFPRPDMGAAEHALNDRAVTEQRFAEYFISVLIP